MAVGTFALFATGSAALGVAEGLASFFALAALFVWATIVVVAPRKPEEHVHPALERVGGATMLLTGTLLFVERDEVQTLGAADSDLPFALLNVLAPILVVGGAIYALRGGWRRQ